MVIAFAGRRVDAPNAVVTRFPAENSAVVRGRIRAELAAQGARIIVSGAACGADLLALEVAGELGIRRVIVLPWGTDRFREESVVDRGLEWGSVFDRIVQEIPPHDLRILGRKDEDDAAYVATNEAILATAQMIAAEEGQAGNVVALVAWNGRSRGPRDVTEAFMTAAHRRGMQVAQILTL